MATQSDVKRLSRRKKKHRNGRKYTKKESWDIELIDRLIVEFRLLSESSGENVLFVALVVVRRIRAVAQIVVFKVPTGRLKRGGFEVFVLFVVVVSGGHNSQILAEFARIYHRRRRSIVRIGWGRFQGWCGRWDQVVHTGHRWGRCGGCRWRFGHWGRLAVGRCCGRWRWWCEWRRSIARRRVFGRFWLLVFGPFVCLFFDVVRCFCAWWSWCWFWGVDGWCWSTTVAGQRFWAGLAWQSFLIQVFDVRFDCCCFIRIEK